MNCVLWNYINTYFPLPTLYLLNLANKEIKKQIRKYYRKVKIKDFQICFYYLLLEKHSVSYYTYFMEIKPNFESMFTRNYGFHYQISFLTIQNLYCLITHSFSKLKQVCFVLCKFKKYKLLISIIQVTNKTQAYSLLENIRKCLIEFYTQFPQQKNILDALLKHIC